MTPTLPQPEESFSDEKVRTACLVVLALVAVGGALYFLRPVVVPFLLAVFFAYCLAPVIHLQMRHLRLPRGLAILGAAALGLILVVLIGLLIANFVGKLFDNIPVYQAETKELFQHLGEWKWLDRLGLRHQRQTGQLFTITQESSQQLLSAIGGGIMDVVSNGTLVLIFMLFILVGSKGEPRHGLMAEIEASVKRYILVVVLISAACGVVVGLSLWCLRVEFALMFGFLAFLLNFIPTVGSIIATLLPLPVVLLSPELSVTEKVLAFALPGALQFAIGNFIQPRIQGSAQALHPVTILMALIFFGTIWGIVGAFLAVPIAGVLRIVFERVPATQPLATLMAGDLDALAASPIYTEGKPP